jgi:hypothetical protein
MMMNVEALNREALKRPEATLLESASRFALHASTLQRFNIPLWTP